MDKTRTEKVSRTIIRIGRIKLQECIPVILSCEWKCVPFSSQSLQYIKKDAQNKPKTDTNTNNGDFFILQEEKQDINGKPEIRGIIFISRYGNLIHCIPDLCLKDREWKRVLTLFLRQKEIFSISGEETANILLEKSCPGMFFKRKKYIFMKNDFHIHQPGTGISQEGHRDSKQQKDIMNVFECGEKDLQALMPLQENYEREEMNQKITEKTRKKTLLKLRYTLKNQIVLACTSGDSGTILAKAGTNAKGINWCQIGGVYTRPEARNKGVAEFLINELVKKIHSENKGVVLFVRLKNKAAIKLYKKTGFTECGFFRTAVRLF